LGAALHLRQPLLLLLLALQQGRKQAQHQVLVVSSSSHSRLVQSQQLPQQQQELQPLLEGVWGWQQCRQRWQQLRRKQLPRGLLSRLEALAQQQQEQQLVLLL
jgi:hypothetical protein